ncbi:MAG: hypothetical protein DLM69_00250 [Candidatus Chloroheliales bacterium]|nr:MAG: hypothetical protein DLM69_00250 [Chloroflexota bacterium]
MFSEVSSVFGRTFLVGFFLPAIFFIAVQVVLFDYIVPDNPIVKLAINIGIINDLDKLDKPILISLGFIIAALVGVQLQLINNDVLRFMEGYFFYKPRLRVVYNFFRAKELKRWEKYVDDYRKARRELREAIKSNETYNKHQETGKNQELINSLKSLRSYFPGCRGMILPFRIGNAIRSFEYNLTRTYNVDAVTIWPRLITVIPKDYAEQVDASKANLDFFVNSSFLMLLTIPELIILLIIEPFDIRWPSIWYMIIIQALGYLILALVYNLILFALFWWFHSRAVTMSIEWGTNIKSCFDAFRLDLLKRLGYEMPDDIDEERMLWLKISRSYLYTQKNNVKYAK